MDGCVDGKLMSKSGSVSLLPFDLRMAEEGRAERIEEEKQSRVWRSGLVVGILGGWLVIFVESSVPQN